MNTQLSPTIAASVASLRTRLPRLYELKDMALDPSDPNTYFHNIEERCAEHRTVLWKYEELERDMAGLDFEAWSDLRDRAAAQLAKRHPTRGWQALFDVFNEAKGFAYLRSIGCTGVRFIPRTTNRTPDLEAIRHGQRVLCEVKTLNISKDEADKRDQVHRGAIIGGEVSVSFGGGFLNKLASDFQNAVKQLDASDPQRAAKWIVFTVVNFDDWVGDYQREYFAQIDSYLRSNLIDGVEFAFCPASNLFQRTFTMTAATIFHR